MDLRQYEKNKFIVGISTEKVAGSSAAYSGLNTRAGDQLVIMLQGLYSGGDAAVVEKVYVTYVANQVVTLTEQGCAVYD